jgi:hypothetical protein
MQPFQGWESFGCDTQGVVPRNPGLDDGIPLGFKTARSGLCGEAQMLDNQFLQAMKQKNSKHCYSAAASR